MKQSEVTRMQREKMILEVLHVFRITTVSQYDHIPDNLKMMFSNFSYCDIITPLVKLDRLKGFKIRQLVVKYQLNRGTVGRILLKPNYDYETKVKDVSIPDSYISHSYMGTK